MLAAWLRRQLEDTGRLDPRVTVDGHTYAVDARPGRCRTCRAVVLRGLDGGGYDAGVSDPADADPVPLTAAGEAWALATGRPTYRLRQFGQRGKAYLWRRDWWHIREQPPNSAPDFSGPVVVLAGHECGKYPPPQFIYSSDSSSNSSDGNSSPARNGKA